MSYISIYSLLIHFIKAAFFFTKTNVKEIYSILQVPHAKAHSGKVRFVL